MDKCKCGANNFSAIETLHHSGYLEDGKLMIRSDKGEAGGIDGIVCQECQAELPATEIILI